MTSITATLSPRRTIEAHPGLVSAAITAVMVNIAIHAYLTPMHLDEKFYIGVLFCIGNAAFAGSLAMLASRRTRDLGWLLASATALAELGGYVASRTVGLPEGYLESWTGQTEDLLGLVSLVTDAAVVGCALAALAPAWRTWRPAVLRAHHAIEAAASR